jgi:pimeloyl-ACP methyl ester carboxylesterase
MWQYRHAHLVADLFALLDHLQVQRSYVLGSSFGATVALAAAHARPERLPRVIVQGGFARRPLQRAELFLARVLCYLPGTMAGLPLRERVLRRSHYEPFAECPSAFWSNCLQWTGIPSVSGVAYQAQMLHRADLRRLLPAIHQPVLLICGDRDPLIGPAHEEVLLKGLPNAGRITLEGSGHLPYFTHPDLLAAVVQNFLTPRGD